MGHSPRTALSVSNVEKTGEQLSEIAQNLWWSWHHDARALFRDVNPTAYEASDGNPLVTLRKTPASQRRALLKNTDFAQRVDQVYTQMHRELSGKSWYAREYGKKVPGVTAYFCMEYALHESLPLYAGGLGVLAGDHLKSASDLGLPFVAVGIFWHRGYTRQQLDRNGCQQDVFPRLALNNAPMNEVSLPNGQPLRIEVPVADRIVYARAWCVDVGRIPLYLLDTDIPENRATDRKLVQMLYDTAKESRIRQEILLGVGGWRLLRALNIPVTACHLNEGHAAFLSVERMAEDMNKHDASFKKALKHVYDTTVFTTHTPIAAGNEVFPTAEVVKYLAPYCKRMNLRMAEFLDLGRVNPGDQHEAFGMTPLALRTARRSNGVSALHGQVARKMWKGLYGTSAAQVPIGHVTNGIHIQTWLHPRMSELLDETLGKDWMLDQDRAVLWKKVQNIPDQRLWELHQELKCQMVAFCRERLKRQLQRGKVAGISVRDIANILDPDVLTIGFARRFAPYKRATLIFQDAARLARLLGNRHRPVQIIFAGKAHPADQGGKALIKAVFDYSRQKAFVKRVLFIEDYEMNVARHLVAGCDVWLNNPERPREASGTSGMKPTLHGGLNCSILDGWWPEGYNRRNGWAFGSTRDHDGTRAADRRDGQDLYQVLEKKVVPLYYTRDAAGLPRQWIAMMKNCLMTIPPVFNMHRQVKQYLREYYIKAMKKA